MYYGEKFNSYSHLVGLILAILGTTILILRSSYYGYAINIVSVSIYGATLILVFLFSTLFHSIRPSRAKTIFWYLDHAAIYLLIAGSYTPFTLVTLPSIWGWSIFIVVWSLAIIGIVLDLCFKKQVVTLTICLLMGWVIVVATKPLIENLPVIGLGFLVLGGVFYSAGVYWFVNEHRIKHAHGIWHTFVLLGSISQFFAVYGYTTVASN